MPQNLLYGWHAYLCRESSVADAALEWPFFRVTSVVDLQRRIAGEGFEAQVAGRVATDCEENQQLDRNRVFDID